MANFSLLCTVKAVPEGSGAGQQLGPTGAVGLLEGGLALLSCRLQPHHEETQVQAHSLKVDGRHSIKVFKLIKTGS